GDWREAMSLRQLGKLVGISVLFLALAATVFAQRADRGTITGVVTDPTGKSIPGAAVKVKSEDTGVVTELTANEAGAYLSPSLTLGTYTVTVESAGFKATSRTGIRLAGGQTFRQDIAMELGAVSDQVTVSASAEILNTTNADVSHSADATYYRNLPVVMGGDIRL